jgi:hypothetical protein
LNTNFTWAADDDRLAELEKKIEVMQAAYESKIDSLESRIEELEGEKAKASAKKQVQTPPPADPSYVADYTVPTPSATVDENPIILPIPLKSTPLNGCGNMLMPCKPLSNSNTSRFRRKNPSGDLNFMAICDPVLASTATAIR